MDFSNPPALLLFLVLPILVALGWPTHGVGRRREIASLAIRLVIAACLILAISGLQILGSSKNLAVVFLVDRSDSISADGRSAEENYVRAAINSMSPDDRAAVVAFGGDALIERSMSRASAFDSINSIPDPTQTDLAGAIRLGLALYPSGFARRMVILSDGKETGGEAVSAARIASASSVQMLGWQVSAPTGPEIAITDLEAPAKLHSGEHFNLEVALNATESTRAGLRVLAGGELIYEGTLELKSGMNAFSIPLIAEGRSFAEGSFVRYSVQIDPEKDTHYQNNEMLAFSEVLGPPNVLLVAPKPGEPLGYGEEMRPDEYSDLLKALESGGYQVKVIRPSGLPSDLAELSSFKAIFLVDVPARELSQRQMLAVQSYVRDLGGGLVAVGGPTSFGVGGYFKTPLEETLPVEMQIKDETRRPSLTMVFIIDHSGSMSETSGGATKLALAKEAAIRSVELLFPTDRVGVITFDDSASWVVPVTDLSDPNMVANAIGTIRVGGGTDILAGLQAMAKVLPDDPARIKHVILLTDGGASPAGIPELVQALHQDDGITLTTVGVGLDAAPFLGDLASIGGGRYYFTVDPGSIPSIFTEETTLATRAYLVEESFYPALKSPSPILNGIKETPPLHGYVGTTAKPAAQTILVSPQGDPILAAWRYGLGKAIAFTSDGTGRWGRDWAAWDRFPTFWAQVANYVLNSNSDSGLDINVIQDKGAANLSVEARNEDGEYLNGYDFRANIIEPDGETNSIQLNQVAPGRYDGKFSAESTGAYLLSVTGRQESSTAVNTGERLAMRAGWVLSYSPEYRSIDTGPGVIPKIATVAGNGLAPQDPSRVFEHDLAAPPIHQPVWPWLLALAAILLPFDIGLRRLVLARSDFRRAYAKILTVLRSSKTEAVEAPGRSGRMQALKQAKERATSRAEETIQGIVTSNPEIPGDDFREKDIVKSKRSIKVDPEEAASGKPEGQAGPPSTAAVLLAKKRGKKNS